MSLDYPHALSCAVWRGADPDECDCDITSSKELTGDEVRLMLRYLQDLDAAGVLAEKAAEYLERRAAG